jgi:hypothetical protein
VCGLGITYGWTGFMSLKIINVKFLSKSRIVFFMSVFVL